MKITELLEGVLRHRTYDIGNYPSSTDRALAHVYNNVIPALSHLFKIPVANFKLQTDWGYGWSKWRPTKLHSTENALLQVILRRKDLDVDIIARLLPKALKNQLEKQLPDVKVEVIKVEPEFQDDTGRRHPPTILMKFTTDVPQKWKDWDKERFNFT